jgi:hypothetical protein
MGSVQSHQQSRTRKMMMDGVAGDQGNTKTCAQNHIFTSRMFFAARGYFAKAASTNSLNRCSPRGESSKTAATVKAQGLKNTAETILLSVKQLLTSISDDTMYQCVTVRACAQLLKRMENLMMPDSRRFPTGLD